jgi:hypothetical protein
VETKKIEILFNLYVKCILNYYQPQMLNYYQLLSNDRRSNVIENQSPQPQGQHVRLSREQKENMRREKCEASQQKIDRYNTDFPLLPVSRDLVVDAQKIAYIDAKFAAEKEDQQKMET